MIYNKYQFQNFCDKVFCELGARRMHKKLGWCSWAILLWLITAPELRAGYDKIVTFTGTAGLYPGGGPYAALTSDGQGYLWGTTNFGGANSAGTIFKINQITGAFTLVNQFTTASGGQYPTEARLLNDGQGFMWGSTRDSVSGFGLGTIFKVAVDSGELTTVITLTGTGGNAPGSFMKGTLIRYGEMIWGTCQGGGLAGQGTVFKINRSNGEFTTVVQFQDGFQMKGSGPFSGLTDDGAGVLWGTTTTGGVGGAGTLFKIDPSTGVLSTVFQFGNGVGKYPNGLCSLSPDMLWGTTSSGGSNEFGTLFKVNRITGELTTVLQFTGQGGSANGQSPKQELSMDGAGRLWGATGGGGVFGIGFGTIFRFDPSTGKFTTMYEFTSIGGAETSGEGPSGLVRDGLGYVWGTTRLGNGTVWRLAEESFLDATSLDATLVSATSGTMQGTVTLPGRATTAWFEYIAKGVHMSRTKSLAQNLGGVSGVVPISQALTGLEPGRIYIYRCVVRDAAGNTAYGMDKTFSTPAQPPTVLNQSASDITDSTARLNCTINAGGAETTISFEYGLTTAYGTTVVLPRTEWVAADENVLITGLQPGTTYHFRARASNSEGTAIGPDTVFGTTGRPPSTPVAVTGGTASVTPATALLLGQVIPNGALTQAYFEFGPTEDYGFATPSQAVGNGFDPVLVSLPAEALLSGTVYYYRLVSTNSLGTAYGDASTFLTLPPPPAVTTGASNSLSTTSVRVAGAVNAQNAVTQVYFDLGTDGVTFPYSLSASPSTVTGISTTTVSADFANLRQSTTYYYRVRAISVGGTAIGAVKTFDIATLSGLLQVYPVAPPSAEGFLIANLTPRGLLHGWRFIGEQQWRASGVPVGGLTTGDREIEFRPVPGYIQPPQEAVSIISGEAATVLTRDYFVTATNGSGGLSVTLKPDSILSSSGRAQWRLLGENDTQWRDSGSTLTGLIPGSYLIECKAVTGRATPIPANVIVSNAQTAVPTITYFLSDSQTGTPPSVLAFETVSTDTSKPYAYVGQIRSNVGSSSGFVVKARVVATAGHVVWDDGSLSAVQGLQWLFQRHRGTYEPKPIIPRGFYLFDGYAAQRVIDNSPGDSSPQSQHLDVAAMYFNEDAGRGGYGGFLASDLAQNEFLIYSAQKMIIGYPVDGIATTSQGRMHATAPFDVVFTAAFGRTFTTTGIRSSGGNSGGPLCVQFEGGAYYPAAIYLGGNNQTVVRAIDSAVIDLFNRAETSGNGGGNNTGGGITHTSVTAYGSAANPGAIKVLIEFAGAANAGAGWRLSPETSYRQSGAQKSGLNAGNYVLQLATVQGYAAPAAQSLTVTGGTLTTVTYTYALPVVLTAQETWRQTFFGITTNTGSAADNADADGDGMTNLAEYTAGTNPNSRIDVFKVSSHQKSGSTFTLTTAGKSGRTYILERNTTLDSASWSTVTSQGPLGADASVTLTDSASPAGRAFYRIRVTGPQ